MRPLVPAVLGAALLAGALALPALAKTEAAKKDVAHPRWAHSYASALDEMKERGCVLLVTFHAEH